MTLREHYAKNVIPELKKVLHKTQDLAVPRITKAVINVGLGKSLREEKFKEAVEKTLKNITGQKPMPTQAKKSIAGFNIREGLTVGEKVTLRGHRMYDFLDKMINIALPRVRDFQGLNKNSIDNNGNLTIGFKEHIAFPEVSTEEISNIHGLEVTITTTARDKEEAYELFKLLKFPFKP